MSAPNDPAAASIQLDRLILGEWQTNCYILSCRGKSLIVDPAAEADRILAAVAGTTVKAILLTHAHRDHIQALEVVRQATGAPVGIHPADAAAYGVSGDLALNHDDHLSLGGRRLRIVHTPGHTPGSICLRFDDRALVGDTFFPGGPGHSKTPATLAQLVTSLRERVFRWPGRVAFYPGHGEGSTISAVRPAFRRFLARRLPPELCGDVEWE
jgi:hydroxyacylglutathione hydrolase